MLCAALFFVMAYTYLSFNLNNRSSNADQKQSEVPYKIYPESKGIAWVIQNTSAIITYLDFKNDCIVLMDVPQFDQTQKQYNGYYIDYTVWGNYALVEGMVDQVGGLNLSYGGQSARYTGNQVVELISNGCDSELKQQMFSELFKQIAKSNFSKSNFVYIMENCKTNLSIVDCITWIDYVPSMSKNIVFVS